MKLHIQSLHFTADKKLVNFVTTKISKLKKYYDQILDVDVMLRLENSGQIRDKIVEVKIKIPGSVVFVRETSNKFENATESSYLNARRQLIRYKEKKRATSHG